MVVSVQTAQSISAVLLKHIPPEKVDVIIAELKSVDGNQSFVDTVQLLETLLRKNK